MPTNILTQTQTDVFKYLLEFKRMFGYMPTTRDIQAKFGYASQTAAVNHLKALTTKGYISRSRKARAILITKSLDENRTN